MRKPTVGGRPFDSWGRHPAPFAFPDLEAAADAVGAPAGGLIIDPFLGSGTAGTFVTGRGDRFVGIEAHPLVGDLARLKLARPGAGTGLRTMASELVEQGRRARAGVALKEEPAVLNGFVPREALAALVAMRDSPAAADPDWRGHLRWILLSTLRDVVGTSWPYPKRSVEGHVSVEEIEAAVLRRADIMARDLAAAPRDPEGVVVVGDARSEEAWSAIPNGELSGSISSPPYLNQVNYAEVTRLENHFLLAGSEPGVTPEPCRRQLIASSTQQVDRTRFATSAAALESYPHSAGRARLLGAQLRRQQGQRARGKHYDRLVVAYLADMASVFSHLFVALAPGARAAWVVGDSALYGIYVDTPILLAELATEVGFEAEDDVFIRPRGRRWPGVGGRHSRPLSERLLILRRPPASAPVVAQLSLPGLELERPA